MKEIRGVLTYIRVEKDRWIYYVRSTSLP